jgi:glutamate-1-semialdehyde 2,1-aminomutase
MLGHSPHAVLGAITAAAARGAVFGAPTDVEGRLAATIAARVPSVDKLRFADAGFEAEFRALHLARAVTGRGVVLRTDGRGATHVPYNDLDAAAAALSTGQVAAVITEPVSTSSGLILPAEGYLEGLRALTREHETLLVFDERITGFRLAPGGAQDIYGVTPDLTVLGGVLGGGLPLAAFGGRAEFMDRLAPQGEVDSGGVHAGNHTAQAAALATLEALTQDVYERLAEVGEVFEEELEEALSYHGCAMSRLGSMFTLWYRSEAPRTWAEADEADAEVFAAFHRAALGGGAYLPPGQRHTAFLSAVLGTRQLETAVEAIAAALVATAA